MIVMKGQYRKVLYFTDVVVKIPRSFSGWLANINEIYNWHRYTDCRSYLCPIRFHDLLGLFIVMERVNPITDKELNHYLESSAVFLTLVEYYHPIANDIKFNNFGKIGSRIVKIDYGNDYWLYNFFIGLSNIFRNLFNSIKFHI